MAIDFDLPPINDPLTKRSSDFLSDNWREYVSTLIDTLTIYLTQYGDIIPNITVEERDSIQEPQEGQMIYTTDIIVGPPRTAQLQIWQVKAGVGAWRTVTTTP
jgi:hypothetical protein